MERRKLAYDLCWLNKKQEGRFKGFYLDSRAKMPLAAAIAEEAQRCFGALPAGKEESELLLTLVENGDSEGFSIEADKAGKKCTISSAGEQGLLYGLYALLRSISAEGKIESFSDRPANKMRMINHWDMFSGEIERGYAGKSIFYDNYAFSNDFQRIEDYARLLASLGINGLSLNNVNVKRQETYFLSDEGLTGIEPYCRIFLKYGIRPYLCVNFQSPVILGGLGTADPLDKGVRRWWEERVKRIYEIIPGFGGFLVKADSEGEPGPFAYGRSHADGANMFACALKPYGGKVIWRCFVYNCRQDWRDRSTDRARAAYDNFKPLDGQFMDNAILQAKFGPMDFQVREPVSPLIGALEKTNLIVEMQITQEYTGQQRHICYLPPQWRDVLDFKTSLDESSAVARVLTGRENHGLAAVGSAGTDENWTGHKLAQANFYGFCRLAWNPCLSPEEILREWIGLTFSLDERLSESLFELMLGSMAVYESYTVPLGVGFMCTPHSHYGPNVDGYEYDRWGTYHFADRNGIGNDRTMKSGTGYTGQYNEPSRSLYENLESCPDELLLFFHHVPYTHRLQSGKTVIQHIYDSHFEGCDRVSEYVGIWEGLKGHIEEKDYENVRERLEEQLRCAMEWRDQINTYFLRKSGIGDEKGREIYP